MISSFGKRARISAASNLRPPPPVRSRCASGRRGLARFSFAMIHDRDGKHKFSFSSDGVGFPGNPKLGWSKPKSAKAAVTLGSGVTEMHVMMNYFHGLGFSPVKKD